MLPYRFIRLASIVLCLFTLFPGGLFAQDNSALIKKAKELMDANKLDEAIVILNGVITKEPSNEDALTQRARSFILLKKVPEASADADRVLTLNPKNTFSLNVRGMVKAANKDYNGAIADFTQAVTIDPAFYRSYYQRAVARSLLKEPLSQVLADYERAYKYSDNPSILLDTGNYCLSHGGAFNVCAGYFSKYKSIKPNDSVGYFGYALAYTNEYDSVADKSIFKTEIIGNFRKAMELDPKNARIPLNLGRLFLNLQDYDQALAELSRSLTLDPKDSWALAMRGDSYFYKNDFDAAIADYTKALEIDPKYQSAYRWRAKTRYEKIKQTKSIGYQTDADKAMWQQTLSDYRKAAELSRQTYDDYHELDKFVFSFARYAAGQQNLPSLEGKINSENDEFYRSLIAADAKNVCARYFLYETTGMGKLEDWLSVIANFDGQNGSKCAGKAALSIGLIYADGADGNRKFEKDPVKARTYYDLAIKYDPSSRQNTENWIARLPTELKGTPVSGGSTLTNPTEAYYDQKANALRSTIKRGMDYDKMNALEKIDAERLVNDMIEFGELLIKAVKDPAVGELYRIGFMADIKENNKQIARIMKRYGLGKYDNGDGDDNEL